jgi:hypothetical protein
MVYLELCCADESKRAGVGGRKPGRSEPRGYGADDGARVAASAALLSKLFGGIEGEPLQVELSEVRILFKLLGFLLKRSVCSPLEATGLPDMLVDLRLQCARSKFSLAMMRREQWNARQVQCGRAD